MSEISETEIKSMSKEQNYMHGYKDGKSDVLDKIREEIKALSNSNPSYWHSGDMVERDDVLEIIDKYKAERRGTENENGSD